MERIKVPYGEANFEVLRSENYLYVDKTRYIEILEFELKRVFFIRPRRFGKSLFLSMLENYYDINKKDRFDELFGDLYIGKNPTKERNQYLILSFDFSGIVTNQGIKRFYESFDNYVSGTVKNFIEIYSSYLGTKTLPDKQRKGDLAINYLINTSKKAQQKLYILIDEYDNFANDLIKPIDSLSKDDLNYNTAIKSEGYLRSFYKKLKILAKTTSNRVFMTGVSPIMLDDLASGFNVTKNITTHPKFNAMLGFTESEVIDILKQVGISGTELETVMIDLHRYYNGYLFAEDATEKMFNSNMFLYFLQEYKDTRKFPKEVVDNNVKTDYRKIQTIAFNFKDEATIEHLLKYGETESQLVERFSIEKMYDNPDNFKSLLFYLGMLTIKGYNELGELILCIPNYVSRKIYWEYFSDVLNQTAGIRSNELVKIVAQMRFKGNIAPFIEYVQQILEKLSNRDLQKFDERYLKVIMFTLLDIDGFYLLESEPELRNGYADLLITRSRQFAQFIKYEWLIELKYIKEKDKDKLSEIRKKGIEQVKNYTESENIVKRFEDKSIKKALVCFIGKGEAVVDEISV